MFHFLENQPFQSVSANFAVFGCEFQCVSTQPIIKVPWENYPDRSRSNNTPIVIIASCLHYWESILRTLSGYFWGIQWKIQVTKSKCQFEEKCLGDIQKITAVTQDAMNELWIHVPLSQPFKPQIGLESVQNRANTTFFRIAGNSFRSSWMLTALLSRVELSGGP